LDYLHPNMASKFSVSKYSHRIALELQRKSLAPLLAILFQRGMVQSPRPQLVPPVRNLPTLYGPRGRKYLTSSERARFVKAAENLPADVRLLCLVLMWSGGRLSETLALRPMDFDLEAGAAVLETLKKRVRGVVRQVPLPRSLISELDRVFSLRNAQRDLVQSRSRLWPWSRATGWRRVKQAMAIAGIHGACAMPKGLRHAFGVMAFQHVPPHLVQRWMGHASLRTTAIYGDVMGPEERLIAARMWRKR